MRDLQRILPCILGHGGDTASDLCHDPGRHADRILDSLTIWTCASCYQCAQRCPQEIKITDIMYMLKRMAIRENRQRSKQARALSKAFVEIVNKYGRNRETALMVKFMLATDPLGDCGRAGRAKSDAWSAASGRLEGAGY